MNHRATPQIVRLEPQSIRGGKRAAAGLTSGRLRHILCLAGVGTVRKAPPRRLAVPGLRILVGRCGGSL